nr:phosphoribosyltransferase family protein [Mycoplasmopsis bovis]
MIMDMAEEIANKDVLIVEDIIDSGITLNKVKEILETRNPKSILNLDID